MMAKRGKVVIEFRKSNGHLVSDGDNVSILYAKLNNVEKNDYKIFLKRAKDFYETFMPAKSRHQ